MNRLSLILIFLLMQAGCLAQDTANYVFFLHNRFLELHSLDDEHPEYGRAAYQEIIQAFEKEGLVVISEKRTQDVNARVYAEKVIRQIDSLLARGVQPHKITVVGTSKGGYIAQYVSSMAANPALNFVFIGSFRESDIEEMPQINFCGNILNIYEKSDAYGVSAIRRKESSQLKIGHFKEVALNTGLKHGFLFKPLNAWIEPTIQWAKQDYN